jgi:hypothetical protein
VPKKKKNKLSFGMAQMKKIIAKRKKNNAAHKDHQRTTEHNYQSLSKSLGSCPKSYHRTPGAHAS